MYTYVVEEAPKGGALFSSHLSNREGYHIVQSVIHTLQANTLHRDSYRTLHRAKRHAVTGPSVGLV